MPDTPQTIQAFITEQMQLRDMSLRQFAELMRVGKSTLSRIMDQRSPAEISIDFLDKLATATNTDITFLVALARPEATKRDIAIMRLAERIAQLPPDKREIIEGYIRSAVEETVNESG